MRATTLGLCAVIAATVLLLCDVREASASPPFDFSTKPDGSVVTLEGVVTVAWPGVFYLESSDRAAGIRVLMPDAVMSGDTVRVKGNLCTDGCERAIAGTDITVRSGSGAPPAALGVMLDHLGGAATGYNPGVTGEVDTYNVGLRVWVAGYAGRLADGFAALMGGDLPVRVDTGNLAWPQPGTVVVVTGISSLVECEAEIRPLIRATEVREVGNWLPQTIMFVGDSLTDGSFASARDKVFVPRTMARLHEAYPGRTFSQQVMYGTDGSPMRTIARVIKEYQGPWPDIVIIQDAATQSNPLTGGAANGLAAITTAADGKVLTATPDPLTPGSGYQYTYPGESMPLGVYVTFRQGDNTSSGGRATISPAGVPVSYAVHSGGVGYDPAQPVEVLTDDWLALAESAIDDVLERWGTPERRPLVVFTALWRQPKAAFELDGVTMNWNAHWARILAGPKYAGKVFLVPEFDTASDMPWALGSWYEASTDGGNTWVFNYPLPFDPTGKALYVRDQSWHSLITGWDGARVVTTAEPRGMPRSDPALRLNLVQYCSWMNTFGDGYHPTDAGHEALGQGAFQAIQRAIAARNENL